MMRQFELVERVKAYDPERGRGRAQPRLCLFDEGARRADCAPRATPISPTRSRSPASSPQMKLDTASIVTGAAARHGRGHASRRSTEIERLFGAEIARLVDGVTKLSRIELQSDHTKQAENFRKLVLAMSEDIRVLLVKLADRLHNMQHAAFHHSDPEKRRRIARETMEIYAPLAERIGMHADEGPSWRTSPSPSSIRRRAPASSRASTSCASRAAIWSAAIVAELKRDR